MSIEQMTEISPQSRPDPSAQFPLVAISILNWNGWQDTVECLESVRRLDYPNYLIVVVDNGSSNGSADRIRAWAEESFGDDRVLADYSRQTALAGGDSETERALNGEPSQNRMVLVRNEENLGFTGGNNVSIHYALSRSLHADCVLLLNNDAKVASDCLAQLVAVAQSTRAGIVGAIILDAPRMNRSIAPFVSPARTLFLFLPFVKLPSTDLPADSSFIRAPSIHGCAAMISRETLLDIYRSRGEYMSNCLYMYRDELDLQFQAKKHGHETVLATKAMVVHKPGKGPSDSNLRARYYFERNTIIVANEILPFPLKVLFHLLHIPWSAYRVARYAAGGHGPRARAVFRAQLDGYRGLGGKWEHHDTGKV